MHFFTNVSLAAVAHQLHAHGLVSADFEGTANYNPVREAATVFLAALGASAKAYWYRNAIERRELAVAS